MRVIKVLIFIAIGFVISVGGAILIKKELDSLPMSEEKFCSIITTRPLNDVYTLLGSIDDEAWSVTSADGSITTTCDRRATTVLAGNMTNQGMTIKMKLEQGLPLTDSDVVFITLVLPHLANIMVEGESKEVIQTVASIFADMYRDYNNNRDRR